MSIYPTNAKAPVDTPKRKKFAGMEVLDLHVGDAIPKPKQPHRYPVRVTPDLARYLLTFNHPDNRRQRSRLIKKYAGDMEAGHWLFSYESIAFDTAGVLMNGQNRLVAVEESGLAVWIMLDFGWPPELVTAVDRGASRSNIDALKIAGQPSSTVTAGAYTKCFLYAKTVGTDWSWVARTVPSAQQALADIENNPEVWQHAAQRGGRIYTALDKGWGPSTWAAAYIVIWFKATDRVDEFFDEVEQGTGLAGSATRKLGNHARRRRISDLVSGDTREPIECIIRAFNAWTRGKPVGFPRQKGFKLSKVAAE